MEAYFVGKGQFSEQGDSTSAAEGTSMAVRQFCAAAFGWMPVHFPSQPWKVERVAAERRYCLGCFGVRTFDVVTGERVVLFCRVCGYEQRM